MSVATSADPITILVNDQPRTFAGGAALLGVVRDLGLADRKGVAVAVNGAVVPRAEWATRLLVRNDRLLVIQATQGG
jgi:sulfur carrier protein